MQNSELVDITASMEAAVRRAYALGRGDALKEVVGLLHNEPGCQKPTALLTGPEAEAPTVAEGAAVSEEPSRAAKEPERPPVPWYLRDR